MEKSVLKTLLTLLALLAGASLVACHQEHDQPPPTKPAQPPEAGPPSALGETPTITGQVAYYEELGFAGAPRSLRAVVASGEEWEEVARGSVSASGEFSITLPTASKMAGRAVAVRDLFGEQCVTGVTVSPPSARLASLALQLMREEGAIPDPPLLHVQAAGDDWTAMALLVYAEGEVSMKGTASSGCQAVTADHTTVDLKLRPGWNSVVVRMAGSLKNELPDSSFSWIVAGFAPVVPGEE